MTMLSIRGKTVLSVNILMLIISQVKCIDTSKYDIGFGIADITGPAAETNMFGYASFNQYTSGIHFRLYSRALIIKDSNGSRFCFVSTDLGAMSQIVKLEVMKRLEIEYNGLYNINNVMLSSTHTHSGPGGDFQYFLYLITSEGFCNQNFKVIVAGIVESIVKAHSNMVPGYIYLNSGELLYAYINRSPTAYMNNNKIERDRYAYDVDKNMTCLKFTDISNGDLGAICWFPVHCTSMNNTNELISGDNKGYASMQFEQKMNNGTLPGKGPFVAMFPQANAGDVSPNINGPYCIDTGLSCNNPSSTYNGNNQNCIASGAGEDMFGSTKIIGEKQYLKAMELCKNATAKLFGPINFIHQTINMSDVVVQLPNNTTVKTCLPAMGFSFGAGTTDGPGVQGFYQGMTSSSILPEEVIYDLPPPTEELIQCQYPKPVLIPTGELHLPYDWQPVIVPTQIFSIGCFVILAISGELTTMSGRRLREAVKIEFDRNSPNCNSTVVISGLTNAYSSYMATFEEYQVQRYEGASTIYGPHTLEAYIQHFINLTSNMVLEQQVEPGPEEPNLLDQQISLEPPVPYDCAPLFHNFGDVINDVNSSNNTSWICAHKRVITPDILLLFPKCLMIYIPSSQSSGISQTILA